MERQVARLLALAGDLDIRDATPRLVEVPDLQLAQLLAPQRVIQQRRQDGAVALVLDAFFLAGLDLLAGRDEQVARLVVAERRRLASAALGLEPLDAFDRVMGDGVVVAEILEQRRQGGQPVAHCAAAALAPGATR
jgi:hypothetical protein